MSKVQHFDFPVSDEEKAQHFYEHVFGWKIMKWDMPDGAYYGISTGTVDENGRGNEVNVIGGGFYKRITPEDVSAVWLTVDSIEETIKKAVDHGAEEVMPKTMMGENMGYGAKLKDPDGNVFGLWEEINK